MVRTEATTSLIPAPRRIEWPSVGVVLVTGDRPHLLRRALASIVAQDYPGPLRVVVVYDGVRPDWRIATGGERPVLVLENWRRAGSAGARNTGVLAVGDCELVAFCDDRDTWTPAKLTTQISAMRSRPGTIACTCAIEVEFDGTFTPVLTGLYQIKPQTLTHGRPAAVRTSSLVVSQAALATHYARGGIGLFDQVTPRLAEDWDLLLRAAGRAPILHLDTPLVRVLWQRAASDRGTCHDEIAAVRWILEHHPALTRRRGAAAALFSELACWHAAAGERRAAWYWTARTLRSWGLLRTGARAAAASTGLFGRNRLAARLRRHSRV